MAIAACPVYRAFNHYLLVLLNSPKKLWFGLARITVVRRGLHATNIADKLLG
jgi:hypothetical protein